MNAFGVPIDAIIVNIVEIQKDLTFANANEVTHVDECAAANGNVCSFQATCENTIGSFRCICKRGYVLAADQRTCEESTDKPAV
uniref:EGF-like domain-containing protein n=1 Tax=Romanomermis culicivorax TaxID=13658 RepID=A0A915I474_ROMCU